MLRTKQPRLYLTRKLMGDEEIDELIRRAETVKLSAETDYPVLELYLKGKVKELRDY